MMHWGDYGWGMGFGWIWMIIIMVLVVAGGIYLVQAITQKTGKAN